MKEYKEEDFLLLSGIQHFAFCKRQWALIHIEMSWEENLHTTIGRVFHEKVHSNRSEKRRNIIITRSLPINSKILGVSGECDVVEFHLDKNGVKIHGREYKYLPLPIQYKKGKPKIDDVDILQLTAQAICLEEMFCCTIKHGYLFYGNTKRREKIIFTQELRDKVQKSFDEMHKYYKRGYIPKVKISKKCSQCSLNNLCIPRLNQNISVKKYIENLISEM